MRHWSEIQPTGKCRHVMKICWELNRNPFPKLALAEMNQGLRGNPVRILAYLLRQYIASLTMRSKARQLLSISQQKLSKLPGRDSANPSPWLSAKVISKGDKPSVKKFLSNIVLFNCQDWHLVSELRQVRAANLIR